MYHDTVSRTKVAESPVTGCSARNFLAAAITYDKPVSRAAAPIRIIRGGSGNTTVVVRATGVYPPRIGLSKDKTDAARCGAQRAAHLNPLGTWPVETGNIAAATHTHTHKARARDLGEAAFRLGVFATYAKQNLLSNFQA